MLRLPRDSCAMGSPRPRFYILTLTTLGIAACEEFPTDHSPSPPAAAGAIALPTPQDARRTEEALLWAVSDFPPRFWRSVSGRWR